MVKLSRQYVSTDITGTDTYCYKAKEDLKAIIHWYWLWFDKYDGSPCLRLEATGTKIAGSSVLIWFPRVSQSRRRRTTNKKFLNSQRSLRCSFRPLRLSRDIHPNPGPSRNGISSLPVRNNQDAILCAVCDKMPWHGQTSFQISFGEQPPRLGECDF